MTFWEEFFSSSVGATDAGLRLLVAAVLGAAIGIDREMRGKPFGLRTIMLVAVGAALFCLVAVDLVEQFEQEKRTEIDPSRVIQGVVSVIGFLGAGAVIQLRHGIIGGTTGAAIWTAGGIGMACGFGLYLHAVLGTAITIVVLTLLGFVERWLPGKEEDEGDGLNR